MKMSLLGLTLVGAGALAVGCSPVPEVDSNHLGGTGGFGTGGFGTGGFEDVGIGATFGCASSTGGSTSSFNSGAAFNGSLPAQFGATITPAVAPPAISGGTLRVLHDGVLAVAADPDRDQVYIVDLAAATVKATVVLKTGDEPGRVIEDGAGRVHVSLRRGGALVTLDPVTWTVANRRAVCATPRGLAYDSKRDLVHVACADGQLVSLPAGGGASTRTIRLDRDLRDVVVEGDSLLVSRFRSAQVLTVNATGEMGRRVTPAPFHSPDAHNDQVFAPAVAWRMVEMPGGGAVMLHQRGLDDTVASQPGGYSGFGPCDSIVHTAVTVVKMDSISSITPAIPGLVLATDMALSSDGKRVVIIATGNANNAPGPGMPAGLPRVFMTDMASVTDPTVGCRFDGVHGPCVPNSGFASGSAGTGGAQSSGGATVVLDGALGGTGGGRTGTGGAAGATAATAPASGGGGSTARGGSTGGGGVTGDIDHCAASTTPFGGVPDVVGEPIAVAFDGGGRVVVQTREPAALFLASGAKVVLSTDSRADTGHAVFHSNAGGGLACASCHPEGTDDGRVWNFSCEGRRRTQTLNIGLQGTAPFHWSGDMKSFPQLMDTVFVGRMAGPKLVEDQLDATFTWIDRQPLAIKPAAGDQEAAARGEALFKNPNGPGCATCHSGAKFTNNTTVDVGTGGMFQVPSLIGVSARAPFMHNGCARTLDQRFSLDCGGGDKHGVTSHLSAADISDLIAFMETL